MHNLEAFDWNTVLLRRSKFKTSCKPVQRGQDIASIQSIARHTTLIQLFTNRNTIVILLNICMFHIWSWVGVYRKTKLEQGWFAWRPPFSFMVQHQRNGLSEKKHKVTKISRCMMDWSISLLVLRLFQRFTDDRIFKAPVFEPPVDQLYLVLYSYVPTIWKAPTFSLKKKQNHTKNYLFGTKDKIMTAMSSILHEILWIGGKTRVYPKFNFSLKSSFSQSSHFETLQEWRMLFTEK